MSDGYQAPSYAALLRLPGLRPLFGSLLLARTGQVMSGVVLALLALTRYNSPELAGIVMLAANLPGLFVSPLAGALLDRHGRVKLVALDYGIAASTLVTVAALTFAGALPAPLLVGLAALASLTNPLSFTGLRSLVPILTPARLWERANATDSALWIIASLAGAPVGSLLATHAGYPVAFGVIGAMYAVAMVAVFRVPDPGGVNAEHGPLLRDVVDGLRYFVRSKSVLWLSVSVTILNISWGVLYLITPVLVLRRSGGDAGLVGWFLALQALGGLVSAMYFGRLSSKGKERAWLAKSMLGVAVVLPLLLFADACLWGLGVVLLLYGLLNGPLDVAMFTLRQRRIAGEWMGRALAVSMSVAWLGSPIASAATGFLVPINLDAPVWLGIAAALVAAVIAWKLIPEHEESPEL